MFDSTAFWLMMAFMLPGALVTAIGGYLHWKQERDARREMWRRVEDLYTHDPAKK